MSDFHGVVHKNYKPYFQSLYDDMKARRDKSFFWPNGTQVYCGRQGSGKTISAVYHVMRLKLRYPNMILVTNLNISTLTPRHFYSKSELGLLLNTAREGVADSIAPLDPMTEYIAFKSIDQLSYALVGVNNQLKGVVYLIDEIHTYFNALDSKNIPMFVFTEISQQRKQRKLIIGTSQVFKRMALLFREQADNIISKPRKIGFFFHNRNIRNCFDTFQKVISANEQYNQTTFVPVQQLNKKGKISKR